MISTQEEDDFVAVRVQDPRIQNEGSWNSYVDYKIFLHTNSKAFTAKTSCVRRRYSEFAWLRKKLQKNAGLVPVPDLPGKSFFSFSNEDFLEGRRKGLQVFLDKVVHMTVCLSDSQLHLFLQTQLPVGHIQDCVQGHTPYSVMDAILTYASSNRGFAQAQEEDSIKEPSLTVSYESMESPAPHQPCPQTEDTFIPELLSCGESDPLEGLPEPCDEDSAESRHKDKPSITVLQKDNHLEAVVEDCDPEEASFFLGDSPPESLSLSEQSQPRSCLIQTPVEVHSPMGTGFEDEGVVTLHTEEKTVPEEEDQESPVEVEKVNCEPEEHVDPDVVLDVKDSEADSQEGDVTLNTEEKTVTEEREDQEEGPVEVNCEPEEHVDPDVVLDVKDSEAESQEGDVTLNTEEKTVTEEREDQEEGPVEVNCEPEEHVDPDVVLDVKDSEAESQEGVVEDVCVKKQELENQIICEDNALEPVVGAEGQAADLSDVEDLRSSDGPDKDESESREETHEPEIHEDTPGEQTEQDSQQMEESESKEELEIHEETPDEQNVQSEQTDQEHGEQRVGSVGTKDESDEENRSLPSSNGSIVKVSDEESVCDEAEEANSYMKTLPENWSEEELTSGHILDLHINGCPVEKEDISTQELQYTTDISDFSKSVTGGDLTEHSDFSVIETSCSPVLAESNKCVEQEVLDVSEEAQEVEVEVHS
ncbi:sorting nexin-11 [Notolabrus celidotus]|uniref:sorting nexin-11 n=1 Tax=Notolabrus celidotus TaxID=1203425 RepID=UPI0014907985|nr:sorting nexin-11 [Notolabrus celidotus]